VILYHNDHLGTPQKMTASNGAVVWSAKYSSFGKAQVDPESTVVNNLRFPGQYFDGESGLHYNWHRYYDPGTGRYLRVDPLAFNNILTGSLLLNSLFKQFKETHYNSCYDNLVYSSSESMAILYNSYKSRLINLLIRNPLMLNQFVYAKDSPLTVYDNMGLLSMCQSTCNAFWGNLICVPITVFMNVLGASSGIGAVPTFLLSLKFNLACRALTYVVCSAHCDNPCAKGHPFY